MKITKRRCMQTEVYQAQMDYIKGLKNKLRKEGRKKERKIELGDNNEKQNIVRKTLMEGDRKLLSGNKR